MCELKLACVYDVQLTSHNKLRIIGSPDEDEIKYVIISENF